ncbi:MAG: hypothetical protein WEG56_12040 [Chloroflexota bacterium]
MKPAHVDEAAFAAEFERYRRQLHVHCYRMLGSVEDADGVPPRAATSPASHDGAGGSGSGDRRLGMDRPTLSPAAGAPGVRWIEPYPDSLLEPAAPQEAEPEEAVASRETIELTYMAAIQHLPPRQRAALVLCHTLGWSAK